MKLAGSGGGGGGGAAGAVRIHATGGPEVLRFETIEASEPGPGEARVRQRAVGVNFIDVYHRTGLYPLPALPHGIGVEAAGVVEAVGKGVTGVAPGDRVAYAGGTPGAYAGVRNVPADRLVPLPAGIDERIAAAALLKGMTVEYLIRRAFRVERGRTVLFHAAAGGVGLIACQWLAHLGATVVGTVGTEEKAKLALAHGCAHAIVYAREDFVARVREITGGRGVPVVYDSVGKTTFEGSLACLAPRGTLVSFGNASGPVAPFDPLELARRGSLFLTRPTLKDYTATREELLACAAALFDVIRSGAVRVLVGRTGPLREAAEAHRALEGRRTTGSLLLVP
ncbi:MAG TPA: quinone oxidoreductase [Planctomycetota bacterium]|nr:quinone oxidoreductase [Planctomycetota bacterium]